MEATTKNLYEARRVRLLGWMRDHNLNGREIAKANGWSSASHVTNLLRGHSPFGEKVARSVEKKLGMPEGYLDQGIAEKPGVSSVSEPPGTLRDDVCVIAKVVIALRDALGVDFAHATAPKLEAALRLVLSNPAMIGVAVTLLRR